MGHYFDGGHFWGMHWIWWIVFLIVLFFLFYLPFRNRRVGTSDKSPLDILKRKYASGQITTEEYKERKRILEEDDDM